MSEGIDFLVELFNTGIGYSAINTARSALSSVIIMSGNISFGAHPIVKRLLKAVFLSRPCTPRYSHVWDVKIVLNYLKKMSPVLKLSLKDLTLKLCVLIALTTAQRVQSLHLMDIKSMVEGKSSFTFYLTEHIKQSRPGYTNPELKLSEFPADRRLCVVTVLKEYLCRTSKLRNSETKLFIAYQKPHKRVCRETISRWIKTVLFASGIDVSKFSSHSTRAASTSAASRAGIPIQNILSTAGWSSDCVFAQYYNKPLYKGESQFANFVLANSM